MIAAPYYVRISLSTLILLTFLNTTVANGDLPGLGVRLHYFRWLEDYSSVPDTLLATHPLTPLKQLTFSETDYPYLTLGGDIGCAMNTTPTNPLVCVVISRLILYYTA